MALLTFVLAAALVLAAVNETSLLVFDVGIWLFRLGMPLDKDDFRSSRLMSYPRPPDPRSRPGGALAWMSDSGCFLFVAGEKSSNDER